MANAGRERLAALAIASGRYQRKQIEDERAKYEAAVAAAKAEQEEAAKKQRKKGFWGTLGSIGGAVAGGLIGGPPGVAIGGSLGGMLAGGAATGDYMPEGASAAFLQNVPTALMYQYLYGGKAGAGEQPMVNPRGAGSIPGMSTSQATPPGWKYNTAGTASGLQTLGDPQVYGYKPF